MTFKFKSIAASFALGAASVAAQAVVPATPNVAGDAWTFFGAVDEFFSFSLVSPGTYSFAVGAGAAGLLHDLTLSTFDGVNYHQIADFLNTDSYGVYGSTTISGPGTYYLYVDTKDSVTPYGGGFTTSLVASAVPEPETYAMMLAGLGALGFMARRRKAG